MGFRTLMKVVCVSATLACFGLAHAQVFRLKPIPPRGPRAAAVTAAAARAVAANASTTSIASPWQALNNQPPFTNNDCNEGFPGAANPLLLTDGSVIVQDAGCPDWWKLTPDKTGSYVTDRPVKPADVCCTVYEALGIDPRKMLVTPEGRPTHILDEGELIKELYS